VVAEPVSPELLVVVAIFACGRPLLERTNVTVAVTVAKKNARPERAKALALAGRRVRPTDAG